MRVRLVVVVGILVLMAGGINMVLMFVCVRWWGGAHLEPKD